MAVGALVLITGANGHIGFRTVVAALQAGYRVRAAVRSQEKANTVLAAPSIKALDSGSKLTFTFVPDLLKPGAYDEAVKDVDYIIHLASPILAGLTEEEDFESKLILPAVKGTTNILYSAFREPSIQRVVITSSIVAQMSWPDFFETDSGKTFNEQSRTPDAYGPFGLEFAAYCASKVRALNATEKLLDEQKPNFSVVHVHPAFVIGKNELITDAKDINSGTNGSMFAQILGVKTPYPTPGSTVHLYDIAELHVKALDPQIPDRQSLLGSSGGLEGTTWVDALEIVKRRFPKAVESGVLPADGDTPSKATSVDTAETQKLAGMKFRSYEDQVVSVTEHYLELVGAEKA